MLDRLAETYEQQVSHGRPAPDGDPRAGLIIALALFVLFIVMATVLPILEAGNAIQ